MRRLLFLLLCVVSLTSCSKQERDLEKFVARLNAREFNEAATYIYKGDHARLRYFMDMLKRNPNLFFELHGKESIFVGDEEAIVVDVGCVNVTPFFNNYMAPLNLLQADGMIHDTIYVRRSAKGKKLSFRWADIEGENLKVGSIANTEVNAMNIRAGRSTNSRVVGKLLQGESIVVDDYSDDPNWVQCYGLDHQCNKQVGYLYRPSLNIGESKFFSLSIFESMSILIALVIFFALGVLIVYGGAIIDAIFRSGGRGGWLLTSAMVIGILVLIYMLLEKILFELFLINLPY